MDGNATVSVLPVAELLEMYNGAGVYLDRMRKALIRKQKLLDKKRKEKGRFATHIIKAYRSNPERFKSCCCLYPKQFDALLTIVKRYLKGIKPRSISDFEILAFTLDYLANGTPIQRLAPAYVYKRKDGYAYVRRVCKAILKGLADHIVLPTTPEMWKESANHFSALCNLPHCVGVIEGRIVASGPETYEEKNSEESVSMITVVNADHRFLLLDIGNDAKCNANKTLYESPIFKVFQNNLANLPPADTLPDSDEFCPYYLIGQEIFPLKRWLQRPISEEEISRSEEFNSPAVYLYNARLKRGQEVADSAFRELFKRFRILNRMSGMKPNLVCSVMKAAIAIHNFLVDQGDDAGSSNSCQDRDREMRIWHNPFPLLPQQIDPAQRREGEEGDLPFFRILMQYFEKEDMVSNDYEARPFLR